MVLSIIGWFFFALLVLLVVLLLRPVVVGIDYRNATFSVWVRVLFVKIKLLPAKHGEDGEAKSRKKRKKKADRAQKQEEEEKEGAQKAHKERSIGEWIELIKRLASSATRGLRLILKTLRIYDVEIVLPVEAQEASDVAVRYGQMQAAIGGARAVLENLLHIRYRRFILIPDFTAESKNRLILSCKVATAPVIILAAGILAFVHFIREGHLLRRFVRLRAAKKRRRQMQQKQKSLVQNEK